MNSLNPLFLTKIIVFSLVFGLVFQTSQAQEKTSSKKSQGPAVRALLLAPGSPNVEIVTIAGEKVSAPFNVGASGLSARFYPNAAEFNLAMKDSETENKNGYRVIAKVTLPESGRDFILLLEPAKEKKLKVHVINSADNKFGPDTTLFFNASGESVGAVFGDVKKVIAPRQIQIISAPPMKGDVPFFQVQLFHAVGSSSRLFASSRWLHRTNGRNYAFIYRDPTTERFSYKTFSETIPATP